MSKRYWLVIQIVAALLLSAVLLTGCGQEGVTSASGMLTEITMTAAVDKDSRPLYPTTTFATDANAFYCSFKVIDAPPGTEIKGEWTYVSGEVEEEIGGKNFVMDEVTITVEGTQYAYVYYLLPRVPDYTWPKGEYKVVLYVNGEEDASIPFTVGANEDSSSEGTIGDVTIAAAVDSSNQPIQPASVFPPDTEIFYCSFKVSGFSPGTPIAVEWIYVSGEAVEEVGANHVFQANTGMLGGEEGYTSIALPMPSYPDYTWPKGDYRVVLYVNLVEKASTTFRVE